MLKIRENEDIGRSDCGGNVIDVGVEAVLSRREFDRRVLTADFDEALGAHKMKLGRVQPLGHTADRHVDRRRYSLFPSAAGAVSKVAWKETEEKDQEHQASYDETGDDKMTCEKTQT